MNVVSDSIKKLRKEKGFTQAQLAEQVGVSCRSIQNYELGSRYPKREILDKIANLQICWRKDNLDKSNKFVKLADYSCFSSYKQVLDRTQNMIYKLSKTELFDI